MTYYEAEVILNGIITGLVTHITLAKHGVIEESCIACREKDLKDFKAIKLLLMKYQNALEIISRHMFIFEEPFMERIELAPIYLPDDPSDYVALKSFMEEFEK